MMLLNHRLTFDRWGRDDYTRGKILFFLTQFRSRNNEVFEVLEGKKETKR